MSREVLRDAVIYLPSKVVPALVGVIAIPVLTRILPPEYYGQYILAISTLILIASFCISWLVSVTIRFYVVYGVGSLVLICRPLLMVSILLSCALWAGTNYFLDVAFETKDFMLIGIVWLIAHGNFEYFAGLLRARNHAKAYSLALSWRSVAGLLIAVVLLMSGFQGGAVVILAAALSMLIALVFMYRQAFSPDVDSQNKSSESRGGLKVILYYGIPAAFINLITVGLSLADRYFIGAQMGTESVAIYSASYDLAEKTIFFANSLLLLSSSVIGFRIFEHEGEVKAADFLSRLMRLYLLAAPLLVVGLAILSPHIIAILLPEKYAGGALVIPIVALAGLFVGVLHRYSLLLSFHRRSDIIMWCSAGALIVNLLSCYFLIPLFGLVGAASSTLLAYVTWLLFICAAARRYQMPVFPWMTLIRISGALVAGAGGMYAVIYAKSFIGPLMLLASFMTGSIIYAASLFIFGEVSRKEIWAIIHIFGNRFRNV